MLSQTLNEGLTVYRIGPKIRSLRTGKGMGLAQLGDHTGLSAGMLSRIERGQVFPTLPTLLRIALVFGVGLDHFFAAGEDRPVLEIVRRADRLRLPDHPGGIPAFHFESLDFPVTDRRLEAFLAEFPGDGPESAPHSHAGVELIYVFRGSLDIAVHSRTHRLETGDSMYFESGFEHCYRAGGSDGCSAIVVLQGDETLAPS